MKWVSPLFDSFVEPSLTGCFMIDVHPKTVRTLRLFTHAEAANSFFAGILRNKKMIAIYIGMICMTTFCAGASLPDSFHWVTTHCLTKTFGILEWNCF
jgi:hypothetical protein